MSGKGLLAGGVLLMALLLMPSVVGGQGDFPDVCDDPDNLVENCKFNDGLNHWHTFVLKGGDTPPQFSVEHVYPACDSPDCPALRIRAEEWFIGGIYQQVTGVVSGQTYWANVVWLVYDPAGEVDNTVGRRIGIDSTGGTDPNSPDVVWSQDVWKSFANCPYKICRELQVQAMAQNATITLFVRIEDTWKNRRDDFPQVPDWLWEQYFNSDEMFWIDDVGMIPLDVPTPGPITTTISPALGATLLSNDTDRSTTIQFPPGAVAGSSVVTYAWQSSMPTGRLAGNDRFFHLEAAQGGVPIVEFSRPFTIAVRYPVTSPLKPDTIYLYRLSGTEWVTAGITAAMRTTGGLTSTTSQVGTFATLGETNRAYLPRILK
jgi:hypothetical protein